MSRENKPLKVCFPAGERVTAQVTVVPGSRVVVQVPKFDIKFSVEQAKYKESLRRLEKYLEDLILKGMADEDSNPSRFSLSENALEKDEKQIKQKEIAEEWNEEEIEEGITDNEKRSESF